LVRVVPKKEIQEVEVDANWIELFTKIEDMTDLDMNDLVENTACIVAAM
jgi:hypothetical protein